MNFYGPRVVDAGSCYAHSPIINNLSSWWMGMPNTFGTSKMLDLTRKFDGSFQGDTRWLPTEYGLALSLDGSGDSVNFGSAPNASISGTQFTVEAVIKPSSNDLRDIVRNDDGSGGGGSGIAFRLNTVLQVEVYPTVNATSGSTTISTAGVWYHVVGTYIGGTEIRLYVNGIQDGINTTSIQASITTPPTTCYIGTYGGGEYFNGLVLYVRTYSKALTPAQVWGCYEDWKMGFPNTLRRYTPSIWSLGVSTAIAYDSGSSSGYVSASTYNWSHTCAGSNRFLAVDISLLSPATTVSSVTYNGDALTLIGARSTVASVGRIECWGMVAPDTGTHDIEVTLSGSIASVGNANSYTNVHQTSPTANFTSDEATNPVSPDDAVMDIPFDSAGSWVYAAIATDATGTSGFTGITGRNSDEGLLGTGADADSDAIATDSPYTVTYTGLGDTSSWAMGGYELRPITASVLSGLAPKPYIVSQAVNTVSTY